MPHVLPHSGENDERSRSLWGMLPEPLIHEQQGLQKIHLSYHRPRATADVKLCKKNDRHIEGGGHL